VEKRGIVQLGQVLTMVLLFIICNSAIVLAERVYVQIDTAISAPIRPYPDSVEYVGRIPAGEIVEVFDIVEKTTGGTIKITVRWFHINFEGTDGWISEFVTMGKLTKK